MTRKDRNKATASGAAPAGKAAKIIFVALAVAGLLLSLELTRIYVKVRLDPEFKSACAINEEMNCLTAAQSSYAAIAGIPTSVIGVGGYLAMIAAGVFSLSANLQRRDASILLALGFAGFSSALGIFLLIVSKFVIKVTCPYCMATYAVNIALFIAALFMAKSEGGSKFAGRAVGLFKDLASLVRGGLPAGGASLLLMIVCLAGFRLAFGDVKPVQLTIGDMPVGIGEDGHAWIGAVNPVVTLEEFSDYQCPHCRVAHAENRKVLERFKDQVRMAHRHLPLDNACHPLVKQPMHPCACLYSTYAVCAQDQGARQFWWMNDYLYSLPPQQQCVPASAAAAAAHLDRERFGRCLNSLLPKDRVEADIQETIRMKIFATPTLVVDGETLPFSELSDNIVNQLIHSKQAPQ